MSFGKDHLRGLNSMNYAVRTAKKMPQMPTLNSPLPYILNNFTIAGITQWLQAILESRRKLPEWSSLTRSRRVDVMVGLTLHCLLLSLHVLVIIVARATRLFLIIVNTLIVRVATLFGLVRPLRLLKHSEEVRDQLESATILHVAGFNLVLFEGLKKRDD